VAGLLWKLSRRKQNQKYMSVIGFNAAGGMSGLTQCFHTNAGRSTAADRVAPIVYLRSTRAPLVTSAYFLSQDRAQGGLSKSMGDEAVITILNFVSPPPLEGGETETGGGALREFGNRGQHEPMVTASIGAGNLLDSIANAV